MADKLLKYDVAMKSTKTVWQMETPRCYTGDENTVTFDFNITDLEAADLVGVIPNVYLYMRDGSFFQNGPADGVEITGTIVNYTMKGNEGKHSGIARAQLVLVWDDEINPPEKLTSQLYDFEVVSGLENKVAVEVMIQDWTTLTREARTFIDTSADEVDALKGELQTAINTANESLGEFDIALQNGIVAANLAEKLEDFEETNDSRLSAAERELAEAKADILLNNRGLGETMPTMDSLLAAYPTGDSRDHIVAGNIAEVDTLTVTAIPTVAGNITITLNGVAKTVAVDPTVQTTTALLATLIRGTAFTGWTTGGTGSVITFTSTTTGARTGPTFSGGTTGVTGAFVVTINGVNPDFHRYFWNEINSTWTDGGAYQAIELTDGAVSPNKTTFFDFGKNLFNPNDPGILTGKGFSMATGTIIDAASYNISGYMGAKAAEKIMISKDGAEVTNPTYYKIASYTDIDVWISTQTYATGGLTLPTNTGKFRVQYDKLNLKMQIEKSQAVTSYEAYKAPAIQEDFIPVIGMDKISGLIVDTKNATFFEKSNNLFNSEDADIVLLKGFSGTTGTIVDATPYNISGYMDGVATEKILISSDGIEVSNPSFFKVASYTDLDVWISTQLYVVGGITLPTNTGKFRVQYDKTISKMQIEKGLVTPYREYGDYINPIYLKEISTNKLSDVAFTSYGDSITFRNSWQPYVAEYFELVHTNLGIGSTTLAYVEQYEAEYPSFVNANRVQGVKDSNPDILTILGGTNDRHRGVTIGTNAECTKLLADKDKTTYKGALSWLIETFLTWKPTLEIVILTPLQGNWGYDYTEYVNAAKEVAHFYALPFINLFEESGISIFNAATYTTDGLHPNEAGGKRIADLVISKLNSLSYI